MPPKTRKHRSGSAYAHPAPVLKQPSTDRPSSSGRAYADVASTTTSSNSFGPLASPDDPPLSPTKLSHLEPLRMTKPKHLASDLERHRNLSSVPVSDDHPSFTDRGPFATESPDDIITNDPSSDLPSSNDETTLDDRFRSVLSMIQMQQVQMNQTNQATSARYDIMSDSHKIMSKQLEMNSVATTDILDKLTTQNNVINDFITSNNKSTSLSSHRSHDSSMKHDTEVHSNPNLHNDSSSIHGTRSSSSISHHPTKPSVLL
jgi:hypothetical protein